MISRNRWIDSSAVFVFVFVRLAIGPFLKRGRSGGVRGVDRNPDAAPTVRPEDQSGCPMCHDPTDLFGVTQPPGPSAGGEGTARSFLDPQDLDEAIFLFGLAIHLQTAVVLE